MSFRAVVPVVLFPFLLLLVSLAPVVFAGDQPVADRGGDYFPEDSSNLTSTFLSDDGQAAAAEFDDQRAAWIVDNFEDGNIDDWIDEGGGLCTASTSAVAASGSYSIRVDGACAHRLGRVLDISGSMPTGISVSVRSDTVNTWDTYLILGDEQSGPGGNEGAIYFLGNESGDWFVSNYDGAFSCGTRNAGQWYDIDFNVDWACKMYDVSVDGVVMQRNISFVHEPTDSFDRIHVYNFSNATARYDDIYFSTPGVSPLIFEDDFERTSACRWSVVVE